MSERKVDDENSPAGVHASEHDDENPQLPPGVSVMDLAFMAWQESRGAKAQANSGPEWDAFVEWCQRSGASGSIKVLCQRAWNANARVEFTESRLTFDAWWQTTTGPSEDRNEYRCGCCMLPVGQCHDHEFDQEMDRIAREKGYEDDYERQLLEREEEADAAFVRALEAIPVLKEMPPDKKDRE